MYVTRATGADGRFDSGAVRAFAPAQDTSGLDIDGDSDLAHSIIAQLAQESIQREARERPAEMVDEAVADQAAAA